MKKAPEPEGVLHGHVSSVNSVSFLSIHTLLSGSSDGILKLWDVRKRRELISLLSHTKAGVLHTAPLSAKKVLTQGRDGFVKVWDAETLSAESHPNAIFYCGSYSFTKCSSMQPAQHISSEQENLIACPGSDSQNVLLYDIRVQSASPALVLEASTEEQKGMCTALCLSPAGNAMAGSDGGWIFVGYEGGQLAVHDIKSGGKLLFKTQLTAEKSPVLAINAFSTSDKVICGSAERAITCAAFDRTELRLTDVKDIFNCTLGGLSAVCIRPDERIFVTGGWDRRARVFHTRTLKPLALLKYHTDSVFSASFSPDSKVLVTGSKDKKIVLWSIYPPCV